MIYNVSGGQEMQLGGHGVFLREAKLPVLSIKVPRPQAGRRVRHGNQRQG